MPSYGHSNIYPRFHYFFNTKTLAILKQSQKLHKFMWFCFARYSLSGIKTLKTIIFIKRKQFLFIICFHKCHHTASLILQKLCLSDSCFQKFLTCYASLCSFIEILSKLSYQIRCQIISMLILINFTKPCKLSLNGIAKWFGLYNKGFVSSPSLLSSFSKYSRMFSTIKLFAGCIRFLPSLHEF